jgi:hypothetical protein
MFRKRGNEAPAYVRQRHYMKLYIHRLSGWQPVKNPVHLLPAPYLMRGPPLLSEAGGKKISLTNK